MTVACAPIPEVGGQPAPATSQAQPAIGPLVDAQRALGQEVDAELALEQELDAVMAGGQLSDPATLRRLRARVDAVIAALEPAAAGPGG